MPDLFALRDLEPPMGDTAGRGPLATTQAVWADTSDADPTRRILHARTVHLPSAVPLRRLGLRRAQGYHKCGSQMDLDHVEAFRVRAFVDGGWTTVLEEHDADVPRLDSVAWYDLPSANASAVRVEVLRSHADGSWPSWNLATGAFLLDAATLPTQAPRDERLLTVGEIDLSDLPDGVTASLEDGGVRFRTEGIDVAFSLARAAMTHLNLQDDGATGDASTNLLRAAPGFGFQGPMLAPTGETPVAMPALRWKVNGTTTVRGNTVRYDLDLDGRMRLALAWTVEPGALRLHIVRETDAEIRAHTSSAWTLALDPRVSPAHVVGRLRTTGTSGSVDLPAWLDVPRFGSLHIEADGDVTMRSDVFRPDARTQIELKLAETSDDDGDFVIPAGRAEATVVFRLDRLDVPLREGTPTAVRDAVRRYALTALTYRPDTATLTNNGASMHCPLCLDNWAMLAAQIGDVLPGVPADELVRTTLERWLADAPGYGSGWIVQDGERHMAEDEYLMTGTAGLLGLATFLESSGTTEWLRDFAGPIRTQLDRMRARDLDGDGLVESPYRTGTSGSGQWSTCWWDVLSFGWKDAFSNALLYPALRRLATVLPALGAPDLADGLDDWADRLKENYTPTFLNPDTGWLGGWRCAEGKLHDHAFLFVTGAAVTAGDLIDPDLARTMTARLLDELQRRNFPDLSLGLPGNLWDIPDADRADILQGYPYGFYQHGGFTHAQTRHFLGALYRTGFDADADALLAQLCDGLAAGRVTGGMGSGVDWHYPDGRACGYEGLLTDQFGVITLALERFRTLTGSRP